MAAITAGLQKGLRRFENRWFHFIFYNEYLCQMKYQLGDRVLVLHSNEEGEVVDIINDKMVLIDVDGVRFPVYMDQIDFPYFKRFSEKKLFEKKKDKIYIDDIKKEK